MSLFLKISKISKMQPVDDHTLQELQIVSEKYKEGSVLNYFDRTRSQGGRDFLRNMIKAPKQSVSEIQLVQNLLRSISDDIQSWEISVSRAYVAASESYYASNIAHTMSQDPITHWFETRIFFFRNPAEFYIIQSGLLATIKVLVALDEVLKRLENRDIPDLLKKNLTFYDPFSTLLSSNLFLKIGIVIFQKTIFFIWITTFESSISKRSECCWIFTMSRMPISRL